MRLLDAGNFNLPINSKKTQRNKSISSLKIFFMFPINPPLSTGDSNPDVQNLQDVLLFLIQKGDILNPSQLSISALESERSSSIFGAQTTNWIVQFKAQYTLTSPPQEIVNTAVADKLNEILTPYFDLPFIINGNALLSNDLPLVFAKIEIWADSFGMIAAGNTNALGAFSFSIAGEAANEILETTAMTLHYKIFRNQISVVQLDQPFQPGVNVSLIVNEEVYDDHLTDNIPSEQEPAFILVKGYVKDGKGAVIRGAAVNIYEEGFRVREMVATTTTDVDGFYQRRILAKNIGRYMIGDSERSSRRICVEVTDSEEILIGRAFGNSIKENAAMVIDIKVGGDESEGDTEEFLIRAFNQLKAKIDLVTEEADVLTITTDEELSYIASAIGSSIAEVTLFVNAHKFADEMSSDQPQYLYALMRNGNPEDNPVLNLSVIEIIGNILFAEEEKIIDTINETDLDEFKDLVRSFQVARTRTLEVSNEQFTLNEVLNAVFDDEETDLVNFLTAYNNSNNSTSEEFWADYETAVGATLSQRAKMGLQLAAVTGFQPEIIKSLLTDAVTNEGIYEFSTWSLEDWSDRIDAICIESDKLCVPNIIIQATSDDQEAKDEFAQTLKNTLQDLFPLTTIRAKLEGDEGEDLIPDEDQRTASITFIDNNPTADLRLMRIHDINSEDYDLTGISDLQVLQDGLEPFQRLLRITNGYPDAVIAMKLDGIDSAEVLMDTAIEDFIESYSALMGGVDAATLAYSTAKLVNTVASNSVVSINAYTNSAWNDVIAIKNYPQSLVAQAAEDPNLRVLFGSLDYCNCKECLSLYSPAAYLTDMLNFMRLRVPDGYIELNRRRGDIKHIDLTCKNTNTVIPYIDLVNELLENYLVDRIKTNYSPNLVPVKSYQTNGTTNELGAIPEHVEKVSNVYVDNDGYMKVYDDVLSQQVYPYTLPFSLPVEQARVYYQHFGITRVELMKLFKIYNFSSTSTSTDKVTEFNIYAESLGITYEEATIITDTATTTPWLHYGIKAQNVTSSNGVADPQGSSTLISGLWSTILTGRLDILLQQTKIEYIDLLQFLNTEFLNPLNGSGTRDIYIDRNSTDYETDTCKLNELKLVFSGSSSVTVFLGKFYRFIRLWRSGEISISDWDILFRSLNISDLNNDDNDIDSEFQRLSRVLVIASKLKLNPVDLSAWWNNINYRHYTNYKSETLTPIPSTYDKLFRNRSVVNPPLPEFKDLSYLAVGVLPASGDLPANYEDYISSIAASMRLTDEDLIILINSLFLHPAMTPNISAFSRIYALNIVSKSLKLSVREFCEIASLTNFLFRGTAVNFTIARIPTTSDIVGNIAFLEELLDRYDAIKKSRFSVKELCFLARANVYTGDPVVIDKKNIQNFFEDLRKSLKALPGYEKPSVLPDPNTDPLFLKLSNIVYQKFSKEFNVSTEWIGIVFENLVTFTAGGDTDGFIYDLITSGFVLSDIEFINGEDLPGTTLNTSQFYEIYDYFYKVFLIAQRAGFNITEFSFSYKDPTADLLGNVYITLPSNASVSSIWSGKIEKLIIIDQWGTFKTKFNFGEFDLVAFWQALLDEDKEAFITILESNNNWDSLIEDIIGPGSTSTVSGILNVIFTDDFMADTRSGINLLNKLKSIVNWVRVTGLNPTALNKSLLAHPDFTMQDAENVLLAAKAKHIDEVWFKIAKPLRNELRKKQRKALVDYILSIQEPNNGKKWRNENELYAYFLIDVEMESCMATSRIKQAISSIQLFVDRILLGLEYKYINPSTFPKITMRTQYANQWESWRKWYRVWEANRKVFLYPENWIEPDLRDDKSYLFTELEAELNEQEVTNERVEDIMRNYLVKLESIADLEPVGSFYQNDADSGKKILHAFSRTKTKPAKYYYRRLNQNEWTPWEKIELAIESDHIVPYMINGKLLLYWVTFREVQVPGNKEVMDTIFGGTIKKDNHFFFNDKSKVVTPAGVPDNDTKYTYKQIEATLNWTEYKNGGWVDQEVSEDKLILNLSPTIDGEIDWNSKHSYPWGGGPDFKEYYRFLSNNGDLSSLEMIKARTFIYAQQDNNGFYILLLNPYEFFDCKDETAYYLHGFKFDNLYGAPRVWRDLWSNWNQPAPKGTVFRNQKFLQRPNNDKFYIDDAYAHLSKRRYAYIDEASYVVNGIYRTSSKTILNKTLNTRNFKLTSTSSFWKHATNNCNPVGDRFFYEDPKNTYYVYQGGYSSGYRTSLTLSGTTLAGASASSGVIFAKYAPLLPATATATAYTGVITGSATITAVSSKGPYVFQTFYHPRVRDFIASINRGGIPELFNLRTQVPASGDTMNFSGVYEPTSYVNNPYPNNVVDFSYSAAYSGYNWEVFFHTPLLIAQKLKENQQFAEARKWFHYIFDPTSNEDATGATSFTKQRFWKFRPFYDASAGTLSTVSDLLDDISNGVSAAVAQVEKWENNPFKPHVIARMRIEAYMKSVVMKYLDNLIEWGDQLYKRDTMESINEATQLYILASNILGPKPKGIPQRAYSAPYSFDELLQTGTLDAFSNAKVKIEGYIDNYLRPSTTSGYWVGQGQERKFISENAPKMFYFCLSVNDKLLKYWDTIADRLFKIRNCMNISGAVRQLPLFEPPIDPAMLVKAAAAGIDTNSLMDEISGASAPLYKFQYVVQKANEVCADVKALGASLLSALEKKDAESLALIRATQEIGVLESINELKKIQLDEAKANLDAMIKSKDVPITRLQYYSSRQFFNEPEMKQTMLSFVSSLVQKTSSNLSATGSFLSMIPDLNIQVPFSIGPTFGGTQLGKLFQGLSSRMAGQAIMIQAEANMAGAFGSYIRRFEDWQFQAQVAAKEIEQIDKQIIVSQIRISIAEKDIDNQELQIKNAKETDAFMRSKYTNKELYNWMISQVSSTYFQAYQVAYDLAKRAEKTFTKELAYADLPLSGFIKFGYWDSLKKGLMAGEKLQLDIRRMEVAYMDANKRELELTKHISIAFFSPEKILELRELGACSVTLPSWLFEMDYPGHYFRRIKSVSISIPCVAGPYTTIACQLTNTGGVVYDAMHEIVGVSGNANRSVATSSGQNDNGMFELNFRDERYLPFEGCGLEESEWSISLMDSKDLRQFDYDTISDVILHIKYTAQDGRSNPHLVKEALEEKLQTGEGISLLRLFTYAHEFSQDFYAGFNQLVYFGSNPANPQVAREFTLSLNNQNFPYFCSKRTITVDEIHFLLRPKEEGHTYRIEINGGAAQTLVASSDPTANYLAVYTTDTDITPGTELNLPFKLYKFDDATESVLNKEDLEDIYIYCIYKLV
jgi:hypothetical protein